jgi:peptidyl-tRNA hydrolase
MQENKELMYSSGDKLYVVVRGDISPGMQLAQAIHAKDEFTHKFPNINQAWYDQSNYICVLQVADEYSLAALESEATRLEIKYAYFCEPDLDHELTAIAFEPGDASKKLCKELRLALK